MSKKGVVVAIDPGVSTGVAVRIPTVEGQTLWTSTITEHKELWEMLIGLDPEYVVIEQFATSGQISRYGLHTVRMVGGIMALAWYKEWQLKIMPPQSRRGKLDEAKEMVKKLGGTRHEADALAHLLTFEWNRSRGQ